MEIFDQERGAVLKDDERVYRPWRDSNEKFQALALALYG
jgi:hypothetical protein